MPQPIIINATASGGQAQVFGPFDSRGVNALTLWTELLDLNTFESVNTLVYTRKVGYPWMPVAAVETSLASPILSVTTVWSPPGFTDGGNPIPLVWTDTFVGVHDETIVIVQPLDAQFLGGAAASVTDGANNITYTISSPTNGDFGNAFVVDLADPGANNSPLAISSADGYTMTISLETDGGGAIVTTANDIFLLLTAGVAGNVGNNWGITAGTPNSSGDLVVAETLPLTGGNVTGVVSVTYSVTGSY